MKIDTDTILILQIIEKNFQYLRQDNKKIDWNKLLIKSSLNRVLYLFARSVLEQEYFQLPESVKKNLETIRIEGEQSLKKLSETLKFVSITLRKENITFLIAKTFKRRPFVTRDIDLVVKKEDIGRILKMFELNGLSIESCDSKKQWNVSGKGLLCIDVHTGFHWQGSTFLDDDFVWLPGKVDQAEAETYPTPNIEVEVSTIILNILYENIYISILDFLYIRDVASQVNWNQIYEQSLKYGWSSAIDIFARVFNSLVETIYPLQNGYKINLPFANKKIKLSKLVSMPYVFSWRESAHIYVERISKRKYIPYQDLAYFVFAKTRFHLTRGKRVPIYDHWFNFGSLSK